MSDNPPKPDNMVRLPLAGAPKNKQTANVHAGRCSHCNEDLNDLLLQALRGDATLPKFCRRCGSRLVQPLTARVLRCSQCKQWLTLQPEDPSREVFCSACGTQLLGQNIKVLRGRPPAKKT